MEKSNISDIEKDVQPINKKIFLHSVKPEFIPVGMTFELVSNIDYLSDKTYEEIAINDLLDYIPENQINDLIDKIYNKLCSGGCLSIQSIDYKLLASSIVFGDIDPPIAKALICGYRNNIHSMSELYQYINKFRINEQKYINIFEYFIRATKE